MTEQPRLSGVVIWGLCDAASAALLYCPGDSRLRGLVLVNPWARTPSGEAKAYLKHYYLRRFLQPSFWRKVLTGGFNPLRSGRELAGAVATAQATQRTGPSYIERMRLGMNAFARPVLLLLSEHDLTAREFSDLSGSGRSLGTFDVGAHVEHQSAPRRGSHVLEQGTSRPGNRAVPRLAGAAYRMT
jgi:hypothetical protein